MAASTELGLGTEFTLELLHLRAEHERIRNLSNRLESFGSGIFDPAIVQALGFKPSTTLGNYSAAAIVAEIDYSDAMNAFSGRDEEIEERFQNCVFEITPLVPGAIVIKRNRRPVSEPVECVFNTLNELDADTNLHYTFLGMSRAKRRIAQELVVYPFLVSDPLLSIKVVAAEK